MLPDELDHLAIAVGSLAVFATASPPPSQTILKSSALSTQLAAAVLQDLGVPVVQALNFPDACCNRRLHVRQPIKGYCTLLETLPA